MTRNAIKMLGFVRAAFVVAAGIPFLAAVSAFAQEPSTAPAAAEVERVIVIGSNIPTAEEVGANPVLNLNRDLINKSGERNTEEILKALPAANSNSVPTANNGTSQGGPAGATSVSLRGQLAFVWVVQSLVQAVPQSIRMLAQAMPATVAATAR